ncbi:hypothetical protein BASA83_008816 [Batrachochytrium salamandrivorans]|nr:hypothetical protein BASA83_008816 [Batrachochytrium salamandrivorans]
MYIELGDTATVRCAKTDLICTIEFKTKGYFGGCERNTISGKIEDNQRLIVKGREALSQAWESRFFLQEGECWKPRLLEDLPTEASTAKEWLRTNCFPRLLVKCIYIFGLINEEFYQSLLEMAWVTVVALIECC